MNPIYTFTEEYERELAVTNREFDIAMTEAKMMAESVANQLRINMALSELKVMQESGTASDLAELILEAGEEASQGSEGVLAKVFTAIGNFFTRLFNSVQKIFTGKNTEAYNALIQKDEKIQVDADTPNIIEGLKALAPKLEAAEQDHANFFTKIVAIAGVVTLGGALGITAWKANNGKLRKDGETPKMIEVGAKTATAWKDTATSIFKKIGGIFTKSGKELASTAPPVTGSSKPGAADAAHARTEQYKQELAAKKATNDENNKALEAKINEVSSRMRAAGKSEIEINNAINGIRKSDQEKKDYRIQQRLAASHFIGSMFEAAGGFTWQDVINWVKDLSEFAINAITTGFNNALSTAAKVTTQVADNVNAVNNVVNPKPKKGLFGNKFIGETDDEGIEESAESEVDPIEAMLSGLAFGGYHG